MSEEIAKAKRNVQRMIDGGASSKEIDNYLAGEGLSALDLRHGGKVDAKEGAPHALRALAGAYSDPAQQLAVIRKYYPDAKPEGEDNFVYTDKDGKKRLFNPSGFDLGDVAGETRNLISGATAAVGAFGGTVAATPGAGTIAGAGAGGYLGGVAADSLASMISGVQKTPWQQLKEAAWDAGTNAVGQGVGNAASKLFGPSVSRLTGKAGTEIVAAAERMGIPLPTRGTAFQNRSLKTLEQGLANTIGGAGIMERAGQRSLDGLRSAVDGAAATIGTVYRNAEELGTAALKAAEISKERLRAEAAQRMGAVYQGIEDAPIAGLRETQRTIDDIASRISVESERNRFLADPVIQRAATIATDPNLDVQTLKGVLTELSGKIGKPSLVDTGTAAEAQIKAVVNAMKRDRDAAVTALGRGAELKEANRWYATEKATREGIESVFGKGSVPVDLDLLISGVAGQTIPMDAAKVGMKLLDPALPQNTQRGIQAVLGDAYGDIAATRIARMADATAGAQGAMPDALASPSTLLTNWNKSMKTGGEAVVPQGWEDILSVSGALKDAAGMANTSGTSRALLAGNTIQGAGATLAGAQGYNEDGARGGLLGAAGTLAGPAALAGLLANPRFAVNSASQRALSQIPGLLARTGTAFVAQDAMRR